ncbi:FCD domain-containing protein [Faunimonas pinastri]|uniref:FCD domain-containing protein n=1 Tax=Faunimonas pinastri TaxID=1855383 RepID=A0A1H9E120_9HYPH|nr:FCD domain-containing protein [Faunimonas pinastri]
MRVAGCELAWTAIAFVCADLERVEFLIGRQPDHLRAILHEHRAILTGLLSGRPAETAKIADRHIRNIETDLLRYGRDHPFVA